MKHTICFFAAFLAFTVLSTAQSNELPTTVAKGRIMTADGQKIRFTKFVSVVDNSAYKTIESGQSLTIPADNVLRIEQQTGTEAGKWALIMGASGLIGSILGVAEGLNNAQSYGVETDNSKIAPIVLGITAVSTLIGVAIGSGKKKYKTVYTNPKFGTTSFSAPVRIGLSCSSGKGIGVAFGYRF